MVQRLGLRTFAAVFWIQSLTEDLRSHKLQCCKKIKKKFERKMHNVAL